MINCNICDSKINSPIFASVGNRTITSLCEISDKKAEVYFCRNCEHLQTEAIENVSDYYAHDYKISLDSDEDDQLYEVKDGRKIFRTQHQFETLQNKLNFAADAKILDYGCAKSSTMKSLAEQRADLDVYLFDVSEMYVSYWQKFVPENHYAVYSIPNEWRGGFDAVTSFFALEHVEKPLLFLMEIKSLLKSGGNFYCLIPNVLTNTADFVVADHINHFTEKSLHYLFERAGFKIANLDFEAHRGAIVVVANPTDGKSPAAEMKNRSVAKQVEELATYWTDIVGKIKRFENSVSQNKQTAIYGSGFYGTFIAACLEDLSQTNCFIDQNPFLQNKKFFGIPVIAPDKLPDSIQDIYVGLNPQIARDVIEAIDLWQDKSHNYLFL